MAAAKDVQPATLQAAATAPRDDLTLDAAPGPVAAGLARGALQWVAALAMLSFTYIVVWRPWGWHSLLHNDVTLALLVIGCLALAATALLVETARQWGIFAVHAVVIGFLVRSLPVQLLAYPPLHDGYYYFVSLLDIAQAHSFAPIFHHWYDNVVRQVHWPLLQLLTLQVGAWSGLPLSTLWRFMQPALGALTFVAIGLAAYQAFRSWRIAALAGLLGSFSDLVLYYQDEYQPQGTAIVVFTFFIYAALASRASRRVGVRVLMLLVGTAFLFTHAASALVLPLLLLPLLVIPYLARGWRTLRNGRGHAAAEGAAGSGPGQEMQGMPGSVPPVPTAAQRDWSLGEALAHEAQALGRFTPVVLALVVASLTLEMYLSNGILHLALISIDPFQSAGPLSGPAALPVLWWIGLLRLDKYALLVLGLLGIVLALRRPRSSAIVLTVLMVGLFAASVVGDRLSPDATSRFLALWYPFGAIFAAAALVALAGLGPPRRVLAAGLAAVLVGAYAAAGILNAQVPAFILNDTPRSAGAWYGNAVPRTDRLALAGRWLDGHTPDDATYAVDFATRMAPFFFARRPDAHVLDEGEPELRAAYCRASYVVVSYVLERGGSMSPAVTLIDYRRYPRIYDNGSIAVYQRGHATHCDGPSSARPSSARPSSARPSHTSRVSRGGRP